MLKHFTYLVFFLIFSYILTLILIAFWLNTSPAKVNNNQITIKDPDFLFYCDPPSKGICSRATSFNVDVTNTFKEEVNFVCSRVIIVEINEFFNWKRRILVSKASFLNTDPKVQFTKGLCQVHFIKPDESYHTSQSLDIPIKYF